MNTRLVQALVSALVAISAAFACWADAPAKPRKTLKPFASDAELVALIKDWGERFARAPSSASMQFEQSITNVQQAGVDEGGIVKLHGDHLVVLRRGRLFTIDVSAGELAPLSMVNAFAPGVDAHSDWYDELLVWRNTVVVVGYSYQRGGTELGLFDISARGELAHRATYHLRSNDYYSSRNYASRLIGSKLVLYMPLEMRDRNPFADLPAMRPWHPGALPEDFKRIAPARRIYRTDEPINEGWGVTLHTVAFCDLAKRELACEATAVLGPAAYAFYASRGAVYVWTAGWKAPGDSTAAGEGLLRIPLDGSAPSALKVSGIPIDQFSFLEGGDGMLNVLVQAEAEASFGDLALLRLPVASLSDGRERAPARAYTALPRASEGELRNRFIGGYLLYGAGAGGSWAPGRAAPGPLHALRYAQRGPVSTINLAHSVDRIEALGRDAVIVGSDSEDLHFTSVRLAGEPAAVGRYRRKGAGEGETRSHGFFYRAQGRQSGLIGLPIVAAGLSADRQLHHASASVLYLRNEALSLREIGALEAGPARKDDGCVASCLDWYGNSRPLFIKDRVFALLGYEIAEGRVDDSGIAEALRIDFSPAPIQRNAR